MLLAFAATSHEHLLFYWHVRICSNASTCSIRTIFQAEFNTRRNVETCAVLAGCLTQGTFLVTHCLLPKQSGTSDSCTATNEEELFDVRDIDAISRSNPAFDCVCF